ncbi:MAG TPA: LemA family protein, partial [Phycisphaerae bacterium]|nr:LemA family protein [Phycisphaerae bacterium]
MKVGRIVLVGLLGLLVFGGLIGGCTFYSSYKTVISLDERVKEAWSNIDADLQRRYDLIPNLVETVKGYAKHEKDVIDAVVKAREKYFTAPSPSARSEAATGLEGALSRLLVLQEKYPDLKANENFRTLMDQLEGTENRVAE